MNAYYNDRNRWRSLRGPIEPQDYPWTPHFTPFIPAITPESQWAFDAANRPRERVLANDRGFEEFCRFEDTHGNIIRVRESSSDPLGHVWVFCRRPGQSIRHMPDGTDESPHLNVHQARMLAYALLAFAAGEEGLK